MWAETARDLRLSAIRTENDGLFATTRELGLPADAPFVFLCECADPFCTDYVTLTLAEYDEQRLEQGFVLCDGHPAPGDDGPRAA